MHDFLIKELYKTDMETELEDIGFDKSYIKKAVYKYDYKNFKIYDLTPAVANILKQTALSVGADCATHREVITGKVEKSSAILGGSLSQLQKIAQKLKFQPFGLKNLAQILEEKIEPMPSRRTKIVGILNLTTDSFSDGGMYEDFDCAIARLNELIREGADIIELGAESTKPGATEVSPYEQLKKILPVLQYVQKHDIKTPISVDTRSSEVANAAINNGASIINDVSGFDFDKKISEVIAQNPGVKAVIQHSSGTPETMQNNTAYENLTDDIYKKLKEKTDFALDCGIKKENIIVDVGIGFGKTREQNSVLIKRHREFKTLGYPLMLGVSRKSFLNMPSATNEEKDLYTLAVNSVLMSENIDYIRVHNVKIHKNFQRLWD